MVYLLLLHMDYPKPRFKINQIYTFLSWFRSWYQFLTYWSSVIFYHNLESLKFLTGYEKDYTFSNRQASIGVKAVLALLINNIFTPIMVNYYLKEQNLYGLNGLAYDVFFLEITNSFLSLLVRFFEPIYFLNQINIWWNNKPKYKLKLTQL